MGWVKESLQRLHRLLEPRPRGRDVSGTAEGRDPLLRLRGSGKRLWATERSDQYVQRLRDHWQ
jgi:hypothetical protein